MSTVLKHSPVVPVLAILGSVILLGVGTSWAKHALFPLIDAQGTTAVRVGFSALLLLLFWRPWRKSLTPQDWRTLLCYGTALGLMNLCFYMALRTIPFGVAVAIEFAGPLSVALLSSRRATDFIWVLVAVAGLGLLLPLGHDVRSLDPTGLIYAVIAAFCWGSYIVFGKQAGHLHAGHSVSVGLAIAALIVVPVGVAHSGATLLSPYVMLVGLCVAALSSAIPISLEMVALKRLPQQTFGIMTSVEPAVAALLAMILLHEHLTATQCLAIALIMTASMGSALTAQVQSTTASEVVS